MREFGMSRAAKFSLLVSASLVAPPASLMASSTSMLPLAVITAGSRTAPATWTGNSALCAACAVMEGEKLLVRCEILLIPTHPPAPSTIAPKQATPNFSLVLKLYHMGLLSSLSSNLLLSNNQPMSLKTSDPDVLAQ